jgi:hypothetical protein
VASFTTTKTFRTRAQQLRDECRNRDLWLRDGGAEKILADHIRGATKQSRIAVGEICEYLVTDETIVILVDLVTAASADYDTQLNKASPLLLPLPVAARLIAALGQAVRCAANNHDHTPDTATDTIESGTTAITELALAIERATHTPEPEPIAVIEPAAHFHARNTLTTTIDALHRKHWTSTARDDPEQQRKDRDLHQALARDLKYLN